MWEPIHRNRKRKGKQNELGLVIADRCGPLVHSPGVAHPETGRDGLNEPVLLGPGQNGETERGKTVGTRIIHPLPDPHLSTRKLTSAVVASSDV